MALKGICLLAYGNEVISLCIDFVSVMPEYLTLSYQTLVCLFLFSVNMRMKLISRFITAANIYSASFKVYKYGTKICIDWLEIYEISPSKCDHKDGIRAYQFLLERIWALNCDNTKINFSCISSFHADNNQETF